MNSDLSLTDSIMRCVMALIRGVSGDCPCPICLVPRKKQSDYLSVWKKMDHGENISADYKGINMFKI